MPPRPTQAQRTPRRQPPTPPPPPPSPTAPAPLTHPTLLPYGAGTGSSREQAQGPSREGNRAQPPSPTHTPSSGPLLIPCPTLLNRDQTPSDRRWSTLLNHPQDSRAARERAGYSRPTALRHTPSSSLPAAALPSAPLLCLRTTLTHTHTHTLGRAGFRGPRHLGAVFDEASLFLSLFLSLSLSLSLARSLFRTSE